MSDRQRLFNPELSLRESDSVICGDCSVSSRGTAIESWRLGRPNIGVTGDSQPGPRRTAEEFSLANTGDWRVEPEQCSKVKLTISDDLTRLPRLAVACLA